MWRYLINPSRRLVEVRQEEYENLVKKKGFTEAPETKVQSFKFKQSVNLGKAAPSVYLKTTKDRKDGYGESQEWFKDAMALEGIHLSTEYYGQKVGLVYGYPHHLETLKTPIKLIYTMFESSSIPEEWVSYLKLADEVFVPTKFCRDAFLQRGIKSTVIPLGYDYYEYMERDFSQPFTFLHYDAFNTRKGWDILFTAFTEEFTSDEARLVLKTIRQPLPITKADYPNIQVIKGDMDIDGMRTILSDAHCFVFPSRGEGFGLPPVEAMASGIPAIIPNTSGMSEYFNSKYFLQLDTNEVTPIYEKYKTGVGVMYEPTVESLKKQMRWAVENKDKIEQMGIHGAEWIKRFHIRETAKKLKNALEPYLKKEIVTKKPKLAFIMDNITFYSGGRYHNTMQAIKLHEVYDVTIYTNQVPVFINDFKWYELPRIEVCDLGKLDVKADVYFGSPEPGAIKCLELGQKYKKPVFWQLFDPPTWMEKSEYVAHGEINRHVKNKQAIEEYGHDMLKIIVNTENSIESYASWYGLPKNMFVGIHPPLNSRIIDLFGDAPKKPWIYASSRIHMRKAWDETLMAFKPYSKDYQLHIISQSEGKLLQMAREYGISANSIVVHSGVSDLEKYAILSQCKATISSSHFEGFGMWATESRAMGVPVACYDLPSLKEVTGLYKAEEGNVKELSEKLGEALQAKGITYTDHDFDVIGKQLIDTVQNKKDVEISVMYIVLNEEKYIRRSLESVLNRKEVKEVVIIEGADRRYPRANKRGLSVDKTATKIKYLQKKHPKITFIRHGWAENKEELRQLCIDHSKKKGWGLYVDGDEVWEDREWEKLIQGIRDNADKGIIYFRHRHFWKTESQIAVGGQWDSYLFRLFRFTGDNTITFHGGAPTNTKEYGVAKLDVWVNHYGYCKDAQDVQDKIAYYKKRDTNLDVKDTWTDWKKGQPTSPTHGGGEVRCL